MAEIWFLGVTVILILLLGVSATGYFDLMEFANFLYTSGKLDLIVLIFGTAIMITCLVWFIRKF
jgi:uncharacterized integral membrane protein